MFDCRGVELVDFDFRVRNFKLAMQYHTNVNIYFTLECKGILYIDMSAEKRVALAWTFYMPQFCPCIYP